MNIVADSLLSHGDSVVLEARESNHPSRSINNIEIGSNSIAINYCNIKTSNLHNCCVSVEWASCETPNRAKFSVWVSSQVSNEVLTVGGIGEAETNNSLAGVDVLGEPMGNLEGLEIAPSCTGSSTQTDLVLHEVAIAAKPALNMLE